jgi:hypothetical protein
VSVRRGLERRDQTPVEYVGASFTSFPTPTSRLSLRSRFPFPRLQTHHPSPPSSDQIKAEHHLLLILLLGLVGSSAARIGRGFGPVAL